MRINAIQLRPEHVGQRIATGVMLTGENAEILGETMGNVVTVQGTILHVESGLMAGARAATRVVIEVWAVNGEIYPEFDRPTIECIMGSHLSPEVYVDTVPESAPIIDRKALLPGMTIAYHDSHYDSEASTYVKCLVTAVVKSHPVSHPSGTVSVSFGESSVVAVESGRVLRTDMRGEGFCPIQIIRQIPRVMAAPVGPDGVIEFANVEAPARVEEDSDAGFAETGSDAIRFGQGSACVDKSIMGDDSDELPGTHDRPSFILPIEANLRAGRITPSMFRDGIEAIREITSLGLVSLVRR